MSIGGSEDKWVSWQAREMVVSGRWHHLISANVDVFLSRRLQHVAKVSVRNILEHTQPRSLLKRHANQPHEVFCTSAVTTHKRLGPR